MRLGPFIFTTENQLHNRALDLAMVLRAQDDIVAVLVLYTRLVTGETTLANLREVQDEIDLTLALQEEKENGCDPQSGKIETKSESGI